MTSLLLTTVHAATRAPSGASQPIFDGMLAWILLYGVFGVALLALVLLLIREIATWYWKINRVVELLERIEANTRARDSEKAE